MKALPFVLLLFPFIVLAQTKAPAPAPGAAPGSTPNLCDQAFSGITEDLDHNIVAIAPPFVQYAVPYADVQDNHAKAVKVVNEAARQQLKGGEYTVTGTETTTCDGGPTVRVPSGSFYFEGVTLTGMVAIADVQLQMGREINDRFRDRAAKGLKTGWNHKNAPKVTRDEAGQVIPPGQAKKNQ